MRIRVHHEAGVLIVSELNIFNKKTRRDGLQRTVTLPDDLYFTDAFKGAFELFENSRDHIFVTGKAGTGKSTLLQYMRENTRKQVAVLAPTGVGAINVNGQTIHSFFHFPPSFIQKENIRRHKNKKLIKNLDALIIDEVSMVRADLMDGIDQSLRINRNTMNVPFGGVQMVLFGDLFQLPPIVDPAFARIFDTLYKTPYFFSSRVMETVPLKYVELTEIFRQKEEAFISLLNKIRHGEVDEDDFTRLNGRVDPRISLDSCTGCIILTTTNAAAGRINRKRLSHISSKEYVYEARIVDEFDERSYPVEARLKLKKGTQIMLVRNDEHKRWVNGTLATVEDLSFKKILIDVQGNRHEVPKVQWPKTKYSYNEKEKKIEEKVTGMFEQYPIKLAWAITIHKSQGQTFDNVIIDLGSGAFAHGQVYVALSRCTSFEGITLTQPVMHRDMVFDERIHAFFNAVKGNAV